MADAPHEPVIIVKRHGGHGDGHHGGAWKIAFADFMTAMMALFLVLWLIGASNPKQKVIIARYFNPVKLANLADKKGLEDPAEDRPSTRGAGPGTAKKEDTPSPEKPLELPPPVEKHAIFDQGSQSAHDEAAMFRDPYGVLSEIAGQAAAGDKAQAQSKLPPPQPKPSADSKVEAVASEADSFRDPFATVPQADSKHGPSKEPPVAATGSEDVKASDVLAAAESNQMARPPSAEILPNNLPPKSIMETPAIKAPDAAQPVNPPNPPAVKEKAISQPKETAKNMSQMRAAANQLAAAEARINEVEAGKLQTDIVNAMAKDAASQNSLNIEVKGTDEGVLISLTDENAYTMFAVGSSEPQAKTIEVMGKVAQLLKDHPGSIVIRGHTDGRPYKSAAYDNWQLSVARAQMAHYMLVRGGLDEKRIERIEGYADHRLKIQNDPLAAENRRIEILVRKDKS